ncbi:MAG: NAD(P)H-hydrate dehydratase [Lachnospiraceae bacterium]|jgi:hydroxyethylthiazole kinase-like uncharacterized protein yjeF
MKLLLDSEEARSLDSYTSRHTGVPSLCLMERAALSAADYISNLAKKRPLIREEGVFVLSGTGNNGADGIAAARILLQRGFRCEVLAVGDPARTTEQWKIQRKIYTELGGTLSFAGENPVIPRGFAVYADALFGVGLSRPVEGRAAEAIGSFNAAVRETPGAEAIALDIASGVSASDGKVLGTAVRADATVTFGPGKLGLYLYPGALYSGRVIGAEIGLDEDGWLKSRRDTSFQGAADVPARPPVQALDLLSAAGLLPARKPDGNKGTFGTVLVISGAAGMAGAAFLASRAALNAGAGLVRTVTSEKNRLVLQTLVPEAVMAGTLEDQSGLAELVSGASAIVIGPGLSRGPEARAALRTVLELHGDIPAVIDADALNLLSEKESLPLLGPSCVLTPHPGELARLLHTDTRTVLAEGIRGCAEKLARQTGALVAAKDARTWVVTADQEYLNLTGNDGCATGGSGDVLAGLTGGLLAGGAEPAKAVPAAVYFHGLAADLAAQAAGKRGMTSRDLLEKIPEALRSGDQCLSERTEINHGL